MSSTTKDQLPVPHADDRPVDLLGHVRGAVADAGINAECLAVFAQERAPEGRWLGRDEYLADDARVLGEVVAATGRDAPGVDPRLVWRRLPAQVAWPLAATTSALLERTGRLLRIDADAVRLRVVLDGDGASIDGLWIRRVALVVAPDDVLAGGSDPRVRIAGHPARMAMLAADLTAYMEPVVELARTRARVGAPGLWAAVADCALGAYSEPRPADTSPDARRERVAAFMAACAGTPLARRVRWTGFAHHGEPHAAMRYCACCLAYRWPGDAPDPPRPDGLDPRWDRYCQACPLLPDSEVVHRTRHWLDHAAAP